RRLGPIRVRRIEEPALAIDDEKRGIGEILQQLHPRPRRRFAAAAEDAEALAVSTSLAGEAADIHERRRSGGLRSARDRRGRTGEPDQKLAAPGLVFLHLRVVYFRRDHEDTKAMAFVFSWWHLFFSSR